MKQALSIASIDPGEDGDGAGFETKDPTDINEYSVRILTRNRWSVDDAWLRHCSDMLPTQWTPASY
jgi:hypothetical protein